MAYGVISDLVEPEVFASYQAVATATKSRVVQSGVVVRDTMIDNLMAGGGLTFHMPFWKDLADTVANVSDDDETNSATPLNITTGDEIGVRLSRNQHWSFPDLAAAIAGEDPMEAIARRTNPYWVRQLQLAVLATAAGVFSDNDTNDSGDYTHDITGTFDPVSTAFSAEAFIDAVHTMGDSESDLGIVFMHSTVAAKAKKNNLIEFRPDASNPDGARIPFFLGRRVFEDDGMPVSTQDYDTYIFGAGAFAWGVGTPKTPLAHQREELKANGGGLDILTNRVEWCIHPRGHAWTGGTTAKGGPTNASTTDNLAHAASWNRVFAERKQVKIARLRTTEA